jgi:hypothetical protein
MGLQKVSIKEARRSRMKRGRGEDGQTFQKQFQSHFHHLEIALKVYKSLHLLGYFPVPNLSQKEMSTEISNWKTTLKSKFAFKPPVNSDPRLLKRTTKGIILMSLGLCASTSGFSSTIYFPGKIPNRTYSQTILITVKIIRITGNYC